jgi:hypothetical protein
MGGNRLAAGLRSMASSRTAVVVGGVLLALEIADPLLAGLARQSVNDSNGSVPVWFSAAFGLVGFVVAARKPRNPLGWVILAVAGSTPCGAGCSTRWTAGSTGPATTRTRR